MQIFVTSNGFSLFNREITMSVTIPLIYCQIEIYDKSFIAWDRDETDLFSNTLLQLAILVGELARVSPTYPKIVALLTRSLTLNKRRLRNSDVILSRLTLVGWINRHFGGPKNPCKQGNLYHRTAVLFSNCH